MTRIIEIKQDSFQKNIKLYFENEVYFTTLFYKNEKLYRNEIKKENGENLKNEYLHLNIINYLGKENLLKY